MITNRAHGIDISKYDLTFDPAKAVEQLDFVIQRASYGILKDEAFDTLYTGVAKMPIRIAYHYLSSNHSVQSQVDKFLSIVGGKNFHAYACDFEQYYNTMSVDFAKMAWDFIKQVTVQTGKRVMLYCNQSNYMTYLYPSQAKFGINWNLVDLWIAQWYSIINPDGQPLAKDGNAAYGRTSSWNIWQYQNSKTAGYTFGVGRSTVDLNVFNGSVANMKTWLTLKDVTDSDVENPILPGVRQIEGRRNGWRFWLQIIEPSKVRYNVVGASPIATVSSVAKAEGASLAWNGSDYDRWTHALHVGSPSFFVSQDGKFVDVANSANGDVVYGIRPLIQNGVINSRLFESDATATEGHSRCCFGKTKDGYPMHFVSEGAYPNMGLRLRDCAEIMKQYGAVIAADCGGGGDTTLFEKGVVLNVPEDIDNGAHVERRIPQILLAYIGETSMNGTAKEILGNTSTVRSKPSRYGSDTGSRVSPYSTIEFAEIVPAVVSGVADSAADKWLKLPNGYYVNYILAGKEYYNILTQPSTDPIPTTNPKVNVTVTMPDGKVYEALDIELKPK